MHNTLWSEWSLPAVGFSTIAINYVFHPSAKKKQVSLQEVQENQNEINE